MTSWSPPTIVGIADTLSVSAQENMTAAGLSIVSESEADDWILLEDQQELFLKRPDGVRQSVNFTQGKSRHRLNEADAGAGPLRKALGISQFKKRHQKLPVIVDATGGWGQDAWVFASMGCQVSILEKHPVVHLLLENGLATATLDLETAEIAQRISLFQEDSANHLTAHDADVVYLDPMYPHRSRKKADSKKGMQFLQALLGATDEEESTALFDAALQTNAGRIVVKRPKGADALSTSLEFSGQTYSIESPNTRYDIYLPDQQTTT